MQQPTKQSPFATVVSRVEKFPMPIIVLGTLLLLVNVFGFVMFSVNPAAFVPGIGTGASAQALGFQTAGRQLAVALVFALALFGKNVRFLQLAWGLAVIREVADVAGRLVMGDYTSVAIVTVIILMELVVFVYLGAIASGHVAAYRPPEKQAH